MKNKKNWNLVENIKEPVDKNLFNVSNVGQNMNDFTKRRIHITKNQYRYEPFFLAILPLLFIALLKLLSTSSKFDPFFFEKYRT